jgi:hypothetical protein
MPADPTNPNAFDEEDTDMVEVDVEEAPEADAVEQHADLAPQRDEPLEHIDPGSANEADRAEQARIVELDEDDYR